MHKNKVLNKAFEEEESAVIHYMSQPLLSNMMFNSAFPLGIEDGVMHGRYKFATQNSGLNRKQHKQNAAVTLIVYGVLITLTIAFFSYLFYTMSGRPELWDMEATKFFTDDPEMSSKVSKRNKNERRNLCTQQRK